MAKPRHYIVSFSPAELQAWGGYTVTVSLLNKGENHLVTASSFASLEQQVRTLAAQFGQTCSPYIRLADRNERKPAGFDRWERTLNIIHVEPAEAPKAWNQDEENRNFPQ